MSSKIPAKPLTDDELVAWEAGRDLGADLLEAAREVAAGQGTVIYSPVIAARRASGLSQSQFALLLGVSVRTLQGWEQGRRKPTGAAKALISIALKNPEALRAAAVEDGRFELAA